MQDFAAIDFETANNERSSVGSVGAIIVLDLCAEDTNTSSIAPCRIAQAFVGKNKPFRCAVARRFGYDLKRHHHALADAKAYTTIAIEIL